MLQCLQSDFQHFKKKRCRYRKAWCRHFLGFTLPDSLDMIKIENVFTGSRGGRMHKRKLHNKISSGLLVLIAALSLAACGSTGDALEILDTESAQTEQTGQETATATPATSQTTPETTTEPKPKNLTYQTGLYQEKTLADQVSVDAVRELPEGEYGVLSYSYDETVSVWGNGAEDCLVIHDGDREYKVDVPWRNMYSAPPAVEAADYDGDGDKEYYISTIQGTGTGVHVEGLYYVDVQKGTPKVSEYTQVVEDFESRILAADPVYETGFNITAPVSIQKDGNFSLGDFSVQKTYSRYLEEENNNKEEPDMTEVYTGYYDLTHNGYKEKVVTKVYLEEENEDFTEALHKAGNWGTVEVYEYLGDGQYGIIPLWSQEFAIAHAGNVQIFLTQKDGYDYLVTTSLWSGQGVCYYDYNVLSPVNYSFDRYHNELKGADHYDPQFFTGLESWLKEDSLLLVATDIDMPQGQEVILTTNEETHYTEEYLKVKKERLQSVEAID